MAEQLGKEIKKGFAWNFAEQVSFKMMQFIIQIVLTRMLMPEDYGLIALSLAFINFASVFVSAGWGSALIYKKDADSKDFSSVCWLSIIISVAIYVLLFFVAPLIADFYSDGRITLIVRIMSISLILGAFNSVQVSIVLKKLQFRKSFVGNVLGISVSAILGIVAALCGYGVWALVIQYISNRIIVTISFYFLIRWLPKLEFSIKSMKELFSYGWKLMATSMLSTLSVDIYSLVIGKSFSKTQLGTYDTGVKIPANLGNTVSTTIGTVLFPAFSKIQNNTSQIKNYLKKANQLSTFLVFPLLYFVAAMAEPLVKIIFTEKWIEAVPFLQIACFMYSFYPLHLANLQVTKAVGRTDLGLYIELGKKCLDIVMLLLTVRLGIHWVALGLAFSTFCALWINIEPIKKIINYSTIQQLQDIFPSWIICVVTAIIMYVAGGLFDISSWSKILIEMIVAIVCFIFLTRVFNWRIYKMLKTQVLNIIKK